MVAVVMATKNMAVTSVVVVCSRMTKKYILSPKYISVVVSGINILAYLHVQYSALVQVMKVWCHCTTRMSHKTRFTIHTTGT